MVACSLNILRLRRDELPSDTMALAEYLIGKTVVRRLMDMDLCGRIVETEAYPPGDASGHAFRGETKRNRSMFLERGFAYVYFNYGLFYLLNVSSEAKGIGGGVLIRALEPVAGMAEMRRRRGTERLIDLMRGPGRLTQALGIDLNCDGIDLCTSDELWLGSALAAGGSIGRSVRIGISRETHQLRRFFAKGSPFVSGPKRLNVTQTRRPG
jgi:DNA-3-methyladenine glycosylase